MTKGAKIFIGVVAGSGMGVALYYIFNRVKKYQNVTTTAHTFDFGKVADFIISFENFSATPYWDVNHWSWGYGTPAGYDRHHKPKGTISRKKAYEDLITRIKEDYVKISMALDNPISVGQMTALLSFSYNLGYDDAHTIIKNMNKGASPFSIANEIKKYVYAGGEVLQDLVERRQKEAEVFLS